MQHKFVENGWFKSKLETLAKWLELWFVKYIVIPIVAVIPLTIVTYIGNSTEQLNLTNDFLTSPITWIQSNPLIVSIYAALYLILGKALVNFILHYGKKDEGIDVVGLLTLFEVLEKIVSAKSKRFGSIAKNTIKTSSSHHYSSIFNTITQPEQQIALLVHSLHGFFDSIDKDGVSFRVSLISIGEDNCPKEWFYFYPESDPPKIPLSALSSPESALSYCITKKSIVIIEDLSKEADKLEDRHYIPSNENIPVRGSLICYPIVHHHTESTPYVLAIVADKEEYFCKSKKKLYNWILKHFAIRIGLEHSLSVIKREAKNA